MARVWYRQHRKRRIDEKKRKSSTTLVRCAINYFLGEEIPLHTKTMRGGLTNIGRPSALRTHMNSHDNAKRINYALLEPVSCQWHSCLPPPAFACEFPGCTMSFSVQSNARRHLRIHNSSATPSVDQPPSIPYVVEFTQPMITPTLNCPTRLRWKPCRVFSKWM